MNSSNAEQMKIFADYIRSRGLRMTRQRELIVRTFLGNEGHLSTDELHELVRRKDRKVGYATVFRTLKALTDCGLARKTDLDDGRVRFEHFYRHPQHHHIVCVECNRTIEFYSPELEQLEKQIVAEYDFQPVRNRYQIFGICRDCRRSGEPPEETVHADTIFARDALKIAIETEKRGVRFYLTASEIVAHESTRHTFLEMLRDEEKHLSSLEREWNRLLAEHPTVLEAPVFLHFDFEALQKIFPSKEEINRRLREDMDEEEALRLAMAMEKDAADFFTRYADKFNDTQGRDIFLKFAGEETDHYNIIRSALASVLSRDAK